MEKTMTEEQNIQQRLAEFISRETEYWDFWGSIRIVKGGNILWDFIPEHGCESVSSGRYAASRRNYRS